MSICKFAVSIELIDDTGNVQKTVKETFITPHEGKIIGVMVELITDTTRDPIHYIEITRPPRKRRR